MEKKKNSKIKEYWNDKGKSLCLRILHIVCYVLSLGFIILCVYACANTNNKDNKQENVKKGLYKENPLQLVTYNQNDVSVLIENQDDFEFFFGYVDLSLDNYSYDHEDEYGFDWFYSISDIQNLDLCLSFNGSRVYADSFEINDSNSCTVTYYFVSNEHTLYFSLLGEKLIEGNVISIDFTFNFDDLFDDGYFDSSTFFPLVVSVPSNLINDLYPYGQIIFNDVNLYGVFQEYIGYNSSSVFGGVTDSMTDFIDTIGNGLESSVEIFYDEDNSQLTAIGWLSVIVVAVGLTWSVFSIVSGLIRLRG